MKRYLTIKTATKALLALFLAASQPFLCHLAAEDSIPQVIGPFGGLNNTDNPIILPATAAQDLLNVDITPGGMSVKKRKGYGLAYELGITTSPVHGVYSFYDSAGNVVELFFNDRRMTASISGITPSVVVSSASVNATWQCTDSQGFAYCANTARNFIAKTNGTNFSQLTVVSTGTMITVTPERLVQAGFVLTPNRIDFSKTNDFSIWPESSFSSDLIHDPVSFTITAPGSRITHIVYALNRIFWFKESSFGYILEGSNLTDWQVVTVSPTLGSIENTSVEYNGVLYFRGNDSHLYSFDGSSLNKLTRDIQGTVSKSQHKTSNSWSQSTAGEWGSGTYDGNSLYIDTTSYPGSIRSTFPFPFELSDLTNTSGNVKDVWQQFRYQSSPAFGVAGINNARLQVLNTGGSAADVCAALKYPINEFAQGTTIHLQVKSLNLSTAADDKFILLLSSVSPSSAQDIYTTPGVFPNKWYYQFVSTTALKGWISSGANDTGDSVYLSYSGFPIPFNVDLYIATSTFQLSINGTIVKKGPHTWANNRLYAYLCSEKQTAGPGGFVADDFGISPATFTYYSPVTQAGALTYWDAFTANVSNPSGVVDLSLRASTTTANFTVRSSTPVWTSQTIGNIPTISTGSNIQVKAFFNTVNVSSFSSGTQLMTDFSVNWFEGFADDKSYASFHDDAIWWASAIGDGVTVNNRVIRYDLINNLLTTYDLPINGMYIKNQSLYFGSSVNGYVYKFGSVDADTGTAITAYWKSKDFFGDSPFTDKELVYISVGSASNIGSYLDTTYTVNGSSAITFSNSSYRAGSSYSKVNKNIPAGKVGNTFSIKVGNSAANQPFEVFGIQYGIRPKPWTTSP